MKSDDLTVGGRLFQTLVAAILKAREAVTVLCLSFQYDKKVEDREAQ